jgi:hypothetical protein
LKKYARRKKSLFTPIIATLRSGEREVNSDRKIIFNFKLKGFKKSKLPSSQQFKRIIIHLHNAAAYRVGKIKREMGAADAEFFDACQTAESTLIRVTGTGFEFFL